MPRGFGLPSLAELPHSDAGPPKKMASHPPILFTAPRPTRLGAVDCRLTHCGGGADGRPGDGACHDIPRSSIPSPT
ncbi:hypothetical protein VFPFJ_08307 [Purpureocillium lilacinum]|uniref:Uncharacterized protein n=1 Tax=Purpureocillium lilacinum TaxID=33203 RepID=A0A179H864_PURLI|nr:hypothetical protein VFPFJ_08307 [Purpureocillium lilacinum]OAQ77073.1 hypothetical protein VFPBJ_07545 [Purpureocillium lilacinum]OAQ85918.1 hypothetical protein VFPFJ_08307 [Purpureocillium lilacinum]